MDDFEPGQVRTVEGRSVELMRKSHADPGYWECRDVESNNVFKLPAALLCQGTIER